MDTFNYIKIENFCFYSLMPVKIHATKLGENICNISPYYKHFINYPVEKNEILAGISQKWKPGWPVIT